MRAPSKSSKQFKSNKVKLKAPFPYQGGKSTFADEVWKRLGNTDVYVEPFAGSLAILLAKPKPSKLEVVSDTNAAIINLWRALADDPVKVAKYSEQIKSHHDLLARRQYMRKFFRRNHKKFEDDPKLYSAKMAGWWVWTAAISIANHGADYHYKVDRGRPVVRGVAIDQQTASLNGGEQEDEEIMGFGGLTVRPKLLQWYKRIQKRMRKVVLLNLSWELCVTPAVLGSYDNSKKKPSVAVFMDPPYITQDRSAELYGSDDNSEFKPKSSKGKRKGKDSNHVAVESFDWAIEHGNEYRIAYCCHKGDFDFPEDWEIVYRYFSGVTNKTRKNERVDMIAFSPACLSTRQSSKLF